MSEMLDPVAAYDAAFTGGAAHVEVDGEPTVPFAVASWSGVPDLVDHALFIEPCDGPTLDIGCGPGRLVGALSGRAIPCLGIDVSSEAVRQTRARGADALRLDVFDHVPGEGSWQWALLADGNVGIGGAPIRLLRRVAAMLDVRGRIIVEVDPDGGLRHEQRRIRVGDHVSHAFDWSIVGLDAVETIAGAAGLQVVGHHEVGGRHAVKLARA